MFWLDNLNILTIPILIPDINMTFEEKLNSIQLSKHLKNWKCLAAIADHKKTNEADKLGYGEMLFDATYLDNFNLVWSLLKAGAPFKRINGANETCIHLAIRNNNLKLVQLFLH